MTEEDALQILRRAHGAPIDEAHYAAVRHRVAGELAARRRRWQGAWATALAAAVAMLCFTFWPKPVRRHSAPDRTPPAVARYAPAPAQQMAHPVVKLSRTYRKHPPLARGQATHRAPLPVLPPYRVVGPPVPQPLIVKLVTDDPNVVIYWISEKTGE